VASNKHTRVYIEGKRGLTVEVRNNNVDGAIKLLNRKVKNEGLLRELRLREYYEKPSIVRRRKHAEAISRHRKNEARRLD
jgi:small subunit ribosomal protein S21